MNAEFWTNPEVRCPKVGFTRKSWKETSDRKRIAVRGKSSKATQGDGRRLTWVFPLNSFSMSDEKRILTAELSK